MDERQCHPKFAKELRWQGLDAPRVTAARNDRARFHHKYCVVDDTTMISGSYNWKVMDDIFNQENLVILRRRTSVSAFARNLESIWNDGSLSRP